MITVIFFIKNIGLLSIGVQSPDKLFSFVFSRDYPSIDFFMLVLITMVHLLQKVEISAVSSFVDSFAL